MTAPLLSAHAIVRYRQRVDSHASLGEIIDQLGDGRCRPVPRHWMRHRITSEPGVRYLYLRGRRGVCAIVRDGVAVTFVTRSMYHAADQRPHWRDDSRRGSRRCHRERSPRPHHRGRSNGGCGRRR